MINIYDYTDFRKFLRDRAKYLKSLKEPISYRYIGKVSGFKSPGFFSQILKGTCNLPNRFIPKIADVFQLKKRESSYFKLMVQYNQAQNHDGKKRYFGKMVEFKKGRVRTLEPEAYTFYDKWYYSAIRAIINYYRFDGNYTKLSKMVIPNISVSEAKKAIRVLQELH